MTGPSEVFAAAKEACSRCLAVRPADNVLVVMEEGTPQTVADAMARACISLGAKASVASYDPQASGKKTKSSPGPKIRINQSFISTPPPQHLLDAMGSSDALFFQSARSYPAAAIQETLKKGVRILAAFQMSEASFTRTLLVDLEAMGKLARRLAKSLAGNKRILVTSKKSGTKLTFEHVRTRELVYEKYLGLCREPGKLGQLPPGMIATSPREGSGEGVVVVDGAIFGVSKPIQKPIRLQIRDHRIVEVEGGGPIGRALSNELEIYDSNCRTLPSEWGIGLNPGAVLGPDIEGETSYGIVHFGVGRNSHVGGGAINSNFHADVMIRDATVACDGKTLLDSGSFVA